MTELRLPAVNGDDGQWGDILNQFLEKEHYNTGLDNSANGGHRNVTLRPGTNLAGSAPLKFTSGPLMTSPEAGSMEFLDDKFYLTQTTDSARRVIAVYDDSSGAKGDIYYRDMTANLVRLPIGSGTDVLKIVDGVPAWGSHTPAGSNGEIQFNNNGSFGNSSNFTYDFTYDRLVIGTAATNLPDNPIAVTATTDAYLQINLQNRSDGTDASSDFVITADNGDDTQNYLDLGLNNSGYVNPDWDVASENDGYLLIDGGDMAIGSTTPSKKVKFFISNTAQEAHPTDIVAEVDGSGINLPTGKTFRINGVALNPEGEANTASNTGTSGVGLFDNKTGIDLQFKKLVADSSKITITDNTVDHTVGIDLGTVALSYLTDDTTHRLVTDAEKSTWDSKQAAGSYELTTNKDQNSGYAGLDSNGFINANHIDGWSDVQQSNFDVRSAGLVSGGIITKGTTGTINVASGIGWAWNGSKFVRVTWSGFTNRAAYGNGFNYVSINYSGALQVTNTEQTTSGYIRLGHFFKDTTSGAVTSIWVMPEWVGDYQRRNNDFVGEVFGTIISHGFAVTEQTNPNQLKLDIEAGEMYAKLSLMSYSAISTFKKLMLTSDQSYMYDTAHDNSTVDTTLWNDSTKPAATALVTMTTGYWAKALLAIDLAGAVWYAYPQAEYATEDAAKGAPLPFADHARANDNAFLASIVFQKSDISIANRIYDLRPLMSRAFGTEVAVTGGTVIDHGTLTGLSDDDHAQYHDNSRALTWLGTRTTADLPDSNDKRYITQAERTKLTNTTGTNSGDQTKIANIIGGNATTLLGSIPYQSNTDTTTLLAPNTTIVKKFLRQTGTGANGAAPVWDTIVVGDIPTMTATVTGLPITPPNDTSKFLRGDGTWNTPVSTGLTQAQVMAISSFRM